MRVAVVGGTGLIGSAVVGALLEAGHQVVAVSRSVPPSPTDAEHRAVDLRDGAGIRDALRGVDVVVDATNGPASAKAAATLIGGTRRLLEAERTAGVSHHVGISIVGCERMPTAYYGIKARQDAIIAAAPHGWSIVRATQLYELLDRVFSTSARYGVLPAPRGRLQPVDTATVAGVVAQVAAGAPIRDRVHVCGPDVDDIDAFARRWRAQRQSHALLARVPLKPAVARALRAGALTDPHAQRRGRDTFEHWLTAGP